jgi:2-(1,2-epoxy-1,2-dihydrophenyl)acetyl-CoA isomerase
MDGIAFTVEDGIGRIMLDRPEAGNAITLPLARALLAAAIRCQTDAAIRCIVLTGNGRLFCAGGDVQLLAGAGDKRAEVLSELIATFHAAVARLARAPKPLVTLVNGPAAGAGRESEEGLSALLAKRPANFRGV